MAASVDQAFIGVGSNLGDRVAMLTGAFAALATLPEVQWIASSSIYETKPVGVLNQPVFLNAVFGIETTLSPEALLVNLLGIEQRFGRTRGERWGPRTLDLDLLVFADETRSSADLQLPHPRMFDRGFVTAPLRELLLDPKFGSATWLASRDQLASAEVDESSCRIAYPPPRFTAGQARP